MNKCEITINGVPMKAKKLSNGDAELIFKIGTYDGKESLYKVIVKKEYWKSAVVGMKDVNYFMIKGNLKACVTSKGQPFISVEATRIKIFQLPKDENGEINLNYEVPAGTDEIVEISQLINEKENHSIKRAKNKAINYIKDNKKFNKAIVVNKETMSVIEGQDQYAAAVEMGIDKVPVIYA